MPGPPRAQSPHDAYRARLADRRDRVAGLERHHGRLSLARLALFAIALGLAIWLGAGSAPWLLVPGVMFAVVAVVHARVLNARDRAARAVSFYERGRARLEDRWAGSAGEPGERFRSDQHLFADDLDLFGRGSLFELLSTP